MQTNDPSNAERRIFVEKNLESHPIFVPAESRAEPKKRLITRTFKEPDGSVVQASISLHFPPEYGPLTTEDEKVLYVLIEIWKDQGGPDFIRFTRRELARRLGRNWGKKEREDMTMSLRRLRTVTMTWTRSFKAADGAVYELLEEMSILNHLRIVRRKKEGGFTSGTCETRFDDLVLKNLRAYFTRPVRLEVVLRFRSGIAQILYRYADPILYATPKIARKSADLFVELGLESNHFQFVSERRRALERAIKELNGVALSTNDVLMCSLETAKDGDILIVFTRVKRRKRIAVESDSSCEQPSANHLQHDPAIDLVRRFHELFHDLAPDDCHPRPRELAHARKLIARHGADVALAIVEFAYREARSTNFRPANFGAVRDYEDRALKNLRQNEVMETVKTLVTEEARHCPFCRGAAILMAVYADGRKPIPVPCQHSHETLLGWAEMNHVTFEDLGGEPVDLKASH